MASKNTVYVSIGEYTTIDYPFKPTIFFINRSVYEEMTILNIEKNLFSTVKSEYSDLNSIIGFGNNCLKDNLLKCDEMLFLIFTYYINYTILGIFKVALYNKPVFKELLTSTKWNLDKKFNIFNTALSVSNTNKDYLDHLLIIIYLYIYHNINDKLKALIRWILQSILVISDKKTDLQYRSLIDELLVTANFTISLCNNGEKIPTSAILKYIRNQYTYLLGEMDIINPSPTSVPTSVPTGAAEESGAAEEPQTKLKYEKDPCPSDKINIRDIKKGWCKENSDGTFGPNLWGQYVKALAPDKNVLCENQEKMLEKFKQGSNYCGCLNEKRSSTTIDYQENYCFSTMIPNPSEHDLSGVRSSGPSSSGPSSSGASSSGPRSRYRASEFDIYGHYRPPNYIYIPDIETIGRYLAEDEIKRLLNIDSFSILYDISTQTPDFSKINPTKEQIKAKLIRYIDNFNRLDNTIAVAALVHILEKYSYANKYQKYNQKYMELKAK